MTRGLIVALSSLFQETIALFVTSVTLMMTGTVRWFSVHPVRAGCMPSVRSSLVSPPLRLLCNKSNTQLFW